MLAWLRIPVLSYVGHLRIYKEEKRKELTTARDTRSPKCRQPAPHLQLEMARFKRQKRNGSNDVDLGQKEGQGWGCMFFEEPAQKDRSSDKWEVSRRAARSNSTVEVGQWTSSQKA